MHYLWTTQLSLFYDCMAPLRSTTCTCIIYKVKVAVNMWLRQSIFMEHGDVHVHAVIQCKLIHTHTHYMYTHTHIATSGYGSKTVRLGKDSIKEFDCCSLTLQPCRDPVLT